jgi:hypothetical protein
VTHFDEKKGQLVALEFRPGGDELMFLKLEVTDDPDSDDLVETTGIMARLLGPAAQRVLACIDEGPHGSAVRTQAGLVRSLVDELVGPLAGSGTYLCDQLKEELARLMRLMRSATQ